MLRFVSVMAVFAALSAVVYGQTKGTLHPEAEAFRTRDKAFMVGPPVAVSHFEYVVSTEYGSRGCDWILVEHRSRWEEDGATWRTETTTTPTKLTFFNPRTKQLRPFPEELRSKAQSWALRSGRGDVVVVESRDQSGIDGQSTHAFAIHCIEGRTLELPKNSQFHVIDAAKFIVHSEGKVRILQWSGESKEVALDRPAKNVYATRDPAFFVISDGVFDTARGGILLDARTAKTNEMGRLDFDGALIANRADLILSYVYQNNFEEHADLSISGRQDFNAPLMLDAERFKPQRSGVMPHQYPTRVRLTGDFRTYVRVPDRWFQSAGPGDSGLLFTHGADRHYAWYLRDHQMVLREITPIPLADYEQHVRRIFQERALSYVEMVGKWTSYALTNDPNSQKLSLRDFVTTYLRDKRLLDQFVFFGDPADYKNNPTEIMGYLDTPYGRANVTWDRKVSWVPKPAP
ncbi:MAG: hypothetical protein ACK5R7_06450 [Armatimonadota bacterium]|nr:hypothetical protein [Fimbriimonadaceae bacterium]